jgi:hypothetical protein
VTRLNDALVFAIYMYIYIHIYTYMHTYIRIYIHTYTGIRENALREAIEVHRKDISEAIAKREAQERDAATSSSQPAASLSAATADKTTGGEVQGRDVDMKDSTTTEMGADNESGPGTWSYSKTTGKFLIDMRVSHDNIATHAAKLLAERTAEAGKARPYCRFTQEVFDSTVDDGMLDAAREVETPVRDPRANEALARPTCCVAADSAPAHSKRLIMCRCGSLGTMY